MSNNILDAVKSASILPKEVAKLVPPVVWLTVNASDVLPEDQGTWLLMKSGRRLIVKRKKFPCEEAVKMHLNLTDDSHALLDPTWCKMFASCLYGCARRKVFEHVRGLPWDVVA